MRGSCTEAERQALMACEELRPHFPPRTRVAADRAQTIACTRETSAARREPSSRSIGEWDPQPGLALVRLARAAVPGTTMRRPRTPVAGALEGAATEHRPPALAPLLQAQVEIEIVAAEWPPTSSS